MSAEPPLLIVLEEHFDRLRQHHAATHSTYQDLIMTLAERFASSVEKLLARLDGHDALLDAAKKAETAAEAERDDLKARLSAAEDKAKADADAMASKLADLQAKLEAELDPAPFQAVIDKIDAVTSSPDTVSGATGSDSVAPAATADTVSGSDSVSDAPTAPVVATAPSGATTIVVPADATDIHTDEASGTPTMPATTSHIDADGTVTTLDHATGDVTAANSAGQPVEPAPAAVAEASNATVEAGVTVPTQG
jgi:hypothetical protein